MIALAVLVGLVLAGIGVGYGIELVYRRAYRRRFGFA